MARVYTRNDYTFGWISALPVELSAATLMLDVTHAALPTVNGDGNAYTLGQIQSHLVVMTILPQGTTGTNAAAAVMRDMARTFPNLCFILMVGIGGGAPDPDQNDPSHDVRLGDVVVSKPTHLSSGVVQYDFGKLLQDGVFQQTTTLNKPSAAIRSWVSKLESQHMAEGTTIPRIVASALSSHAQMAYAFKCPEISEDLLFDQDYLHQGCGYNCQACNRAHLVPRPVRTDSAPVIHYGTIASANQLMRDAKTRDHLRREQGVLCFEMEAAGLMDVCSCLVIRGICDYSDSHKNRRWQPYAALTAAAYTKELLQTIPAIVLEDQASLQLGKHVASHADLEEITRGNQAILDTQLIEKYKECFQAFKTSNYEEMMCQIPDRAPETCQWVLTNHNYQRWRDGSSHDLLWISADPGCGKSVLAKSLVENELRDATSHTICYFFFSDNDQQDRLSTALCAIIHQILRRTPSLIKHAHKIFEADGPSLFKDTERLWQVLLSICMDTQAGCITCIFDALDESRQHDQHVLIQKLATFYHNSSAEPATKTKLKFLVTSRPYHEIEADFQCTFQRICGMFPNIRIRGEDENDLPHTEIDLVIQQRVDALAIDLNLTPDIKARLFARLRGIPNRTYLWLHLTLENFRQTYQNSLVPHRETVENLPSSLSDVYCAILNRVTPQNRSKALQILSIIVGARRPLTISEMAYALATINAPGCCYQEQYLSPAEHLQKYIRSWCGLFIYISHSHVYLIHQTAKDFLLGNIKISSFRGWNYTFSMFEAEITMTKICAGYLISRSFLNTHGDRHVSSTDFVFQGHSTQSPYGGEVHALSFWDYCTKYWFEHALIAQNMPSEFPLDLVMELYNVKPEIFRKLFERLPTCRVRRPEAGTDRLSLAAFLGHTMVVEMLLKNGQGDLNIADRTGRTALYLAAKQGHTSVVRLLLKYGADVNHCAGAHGTALMAASEEGFIDTVQVLLAHGADVNLQPRWYDTALIAALGRGQTATIQLLLENGANVKLRDSEGDLMVREAIKLHNHDLFRVLLDSGPISMYHPMMQRSRTTLIRHFWHERTPPYRPSWGDVVRVLMPALR